MVFENETLAIGVFLIVAIFVGAIFFWQKLSAIESRIMRINREVNGLHIMESRRIVMELNANATPAAPSVTPQDGSAEVDSGEIVQIRKQSRITAPSPA